MSKGTDGPSKMLRLDSALWDQVAAAAKGTGKTARQEVEARLRDSLHGTRAGALSPATALGRLIELHAGDVAAYCQSAEEWQTEMKLGVAALVNELFEGAKEGGSESLNSLAVMSARTLAQKVRRAHLPAARTGDPTADFWAQQAERALNQEQPSLANLHHEELLELQKALFLSPEHEETPSRTERGKGARKERK